MTTRVADAPAKETRGAAPETLKDKVRAYHDFHTQSINNGNISQEDKDFLTTKVADAPAKVSAKETATMPKMTAKATVRALQGQGYSFAPNALLQCGQMNISVGNNVYAALKQGRV